MRCPRCCSGRTPRGFPRCIFLPSSRAQFLSTNTFVPIRSCQIPAIFRPSNFSAASHTEANDAAVKGSIHIMPHNGLRCCETLLLLVLHLPVALGRPLDVVRRDDDLPARATALNVFAALFTILTLVILAVWLIFRFVRQALAGVSATVTGSTSSSASMTSTTVSYGALIGHPEREMLTLSPREHVWRSPTHGFVVNKDRGRVTGEVRRPRG